MWCFFPRMPCAQHNGPQFSFKFYDLLKMTDKMSTWLTKICSSLHINLVIKIAIIYFLFCNLYVEISGSYISWLCFLLLVCGFNGFTWAIRLCSKHVYLLSSLWWLKGLTFKTLYKVASLMRILLNIIN